MIKPRKRTWPAGVPGGANATERARTIARAALTELRRADPAAADRIVATANTFGETWLTTTPAIHQPGSLLTREQAAQIGQVRPDTVSTWTSRGIVREGRRIRLVRHPGGYREDELLDFLRLLRTHKPQAA